MSSESTAADGHDRIEAKLSDYLEGALKPEEAAEVEQHLAGCDSCRADLDQLKETVSALSGLHKVPAPQRFDRDVAETIRRRSRGRFFGRRALGDRVPYELIALVALALGLMLYFFLRQSDTGSLRPLHERPTPPVINKGAKDAVPRP